MVGDLPCPDPLFEASTPGEFAQLRTIMESATSQNLSLRKWMSLYLRDNWPGHDDFIFASLDPKLLTIHVVGTHPLDQPHNKILDAGYIL